MNDLFRFIGEDGSLGYQHGKIYMLYIEGRGMPTLGVSIMNPIRCPYTSWETFFENWERA